MPFLGEILPLSFQLLDSDATKFCRAVVTDSAGAPLAGTPVSLSNIGGGKYSSNSLLMPNLDYVEVRYEPYDDALFTVVDPDHLVGTDVFRLEIPDSVIVAKLDQILAKLGGIALPGASFSATLVQNMVNDVITDVKVAKALINREDITGLITDLETKVNLNQNQILGVIDCGD
jgi:hypothetical protein